MKLGLGFVFLAEKCHGQQEDRDFLHGGEEECRQRGEEPEIQKHTLTSTFWMVPKGEPEKILSRENPLCQGVVTLGTVMYRIDWGILFLIWFALHAWVCVFLCVSPLSPPSTCCWIWERQQPSDSLLLFACLRDRGRGIQVCVCVHACVSVCMHTLSIFKA